MSRTSFKVTLFAGLSGLFLASAASAQVFDLERSIGYPDFKFMDPQRAGDAPIFVLRDDFPRDLPALDPEVDEILQIDFDQDPMAYVMAVRDYAFAGNIHGPDPRDDFVLQRNSQGKEWYHVPWQHWGSAGREGHHGLTREGPLGAHTLAPTQNQASSAYAVGFYNGPGGYAIGQIWPSPDKGPNLESMIDSDGFPVGTVVAKFLFTAINEIDVPYLANPLVWDAYIYSCDLPSSAGCGNLTGDEPHQNVKMRLLQMDIMVKDPRADQAAEWVFGTFVYNGNLGDDHAYSEACKDTGARWCNLMPVGLMWGNDPDQRRTFINDAPTETMINPDLKQTWINPDPAMPAMHLGFSGRLNGPADNPTSSCMSCHSVAQYPSISAIMPWLPPDNVPKPADGTDASDEWMRWFRNFQQLEAFDAGKAVPLDFSMQLAKSIENYVEYRAMTQGGQYALEYWEKGRATPISRNILVPSE